MSSRHNNTENSSTGGQDGFLKMEPPCVCLRATRAVMRGIGADTSHSGSVAPVDEEEEEMNYSTSPRLLFYS